MTWFRIDKIRRWREWELNPVVVKELRQSVRSWAVTGMLLLFLGVLFVTALVFLVNQSIQVEVNQRLGASVFQTFTVILTGASLLFIPAYVGVRLAAERQESNLDLLYITTLSPGRIIRGKFLCGAYMTLLFFSACMPFMVFTNLLRGVDLPTVFFILFCLFIVVCATVQVAIFLACLPVSRILKIVIALFGIGFLFSVISGMVALFFEMIYAGVGSMVLGGGGFWPVFFTVAGVIVGLTLLFYFLSVAMVAPVSANRALPLRAYITFAWLVTLGISLAWMFKGRDARILLPWAIVNEILLGMSLIVVVSNQDRLSLRVRRDIPAGGFKSRLAFLFYNGAAGGLVWVALLLGATFGITSFFLRNGPTLLQNFSSFAPNDLVDFETCSVGIALYVLAYALAALFIHRQFLPRRAPKLAGIFAVILPAATALAPYTISFFLNRLSWQSVERLQLGNLFNIAVVRSLEDKVFHVICAGGLTAIFVVLNWRWFVRQAREFKPLDRAAPASSPSAVPPPIPDRDRMLQP